MTINEPDLTVDIGGLELQNPVMPASGAFGEGMDQVIDFNLLGAVVPKSITKFPRGGNPTPRVCETYGGMINSIGIQSKGIEHYLNETLPYYRKYQVPLISSISAESVEEFVEMAETIEAVPNVAALELNISCPNLKDNGLAFGMDEDITYELVRKVRGVTNKPILTKLTPNVTNIQKIALAAENAGADALVVANTLLSMAIDIDTWKPKIGNVMGGLSGPAVKPIIVRQIYQVHEVSRLPIIGCGGVMTADDAIEMLLAGATAVQVGTANFVTPTAMIDMIDGIRKYMKAHDLKRIDDIVGKVVLTNQKKVES
ncbi:dihydroorotate dehydrogenase (NAD+) catalytic subunit [Pullulanibacillus pueri]|uniref:Dihydroorotate dehydrogenase n=1 Tax=Pullulanibacillus pueri TaxID=1437324 RepID=A0A8J3ES73_9BACL|nr:dihydroorotate dehydrogenase [Pullulanibacillus pueri]MBM7684082.1 dihydroorotate dehydrogenase (NAD+) catalytic subunit [Pullulanibacillus pueri]GGH88600.1 dihydroorotate dehydrogenase [Pullulanibacillus pueri]